MRNALADVSDLIYHRTGDLIASAETLTTFFEVSSLVLAILMAFVGIGGVALILRKVNKLGALQKNRF